MSAVLLQIGKTELHFSNFTFKLLNVFGLLTAFLLVPLPFKCFYLASVKEIIVRISRLMQTQISYLLTSFSMFCKTHWKKMLRGCHCLLLWHDAGTYGDGCSVRALQLFIFIFHFCSVFWRMLLHKESITLKLFPGVTESLYSPLCSTLRVLSKLLPLMGVLLEEENNLVF